MGVGDDVRIIQVNEGTYSTITIIYLSISCVYDCEAV